MKSKGTWDSVIFDKKYDECMRNVKRWSKTGKSESESWIQLGNKNVR